MGGAFPPMSAADAMAVARKNPQRRYPAPDRGGARLYPLAAPAPRPTFTMTTDDTVFTIGSCFARSVETALIDAGLTVLSQEDDLGPVGDSRGFTPNFFNKYTIPSILNDLTWALEDDPGAVLYPLGNGFADLQLGMAKLDFPRADIEDFRTRYLDVMRRIVDADVVIVTLGYVEVWRDTHTGFALNIAPPGALIKAHPDRFTFEVLDHDAVLQGLRDLHSLLVKHRTKPLRMLITVSPVPLLSTFRDMDVLLANTYSKSVQRAAVESFTAQTPGVDYFPSYETVTLSDPATAWTSDDYRHVAPPMVAHIMEAVIRAYIGAVAMTPQALLYKLRLLDKTGDTAQTLALARAHPDLVAADFACLEHVGDAHLANADPTQAESCYLAAQTLAPDKGGPLQRLMLLYHATGQDAALAPLLADHRTRYPKRGRFRAQFAPKEA